MQVDVDVEPARELEHAGDLPDRVGVGVRRAADRGRAGFECLDEQGVGLGRLGEALLGEHAHVDIDRPGVVGRGGEHAVESAAPDRRVELDVGADSGRAVDHASAQRGAGALAHVVDGELRLGDRGPGDRRVEPTRGRAPGEEARLVEVEMGVDETGHAELAARLDLGAGVREVGADGRDATGVDREVDAAGPAVLPQPHVAHDQIDAGQIDAGQIHGDTVRPASRSTVSRT